MLIVFLKGRNRICRIGILFCCLIFFLTCLPLSVLADPTTPASSGTGSTGTGGTGTGGEEDEGIEVSGSFYDISTSLTSYINAVVGGNGTDQHNWDGQENFVEPPKCAGNAGAYVGYGDKKNSFAGSITATSTNAASSSSYTAWLNLFEGDSKNKNAAYQYVWFGRTLTEAGWDAQGVQGSFARKLSGGATVICWGASEAMPKVFNFSLKILKWTNPFQFFVQTDTASDGFREADAAAAKDGNPLYHMMHDGKNSLTSFISDFYTTITEHLSWAVAVPLLILLGVVQVLLMKHAPGTVFWNISKRIIFIAVGLPLLGSLYTFSLDQLEDQTSNKTAASRLAFASFFDFEAWVNKNRLAVGDGWSADFISSPKGKDGATTDAGTISPHTLRKLRSLTLALNRKNLSDLSGLSGFVTSDDDAHLSLSGGVWDEDGSPGSAYGGTRTEISSSTVQNEVYRLLTTYLQGTTYSPSVWATVVWGEFRDGVAAGDFEFGFNGMEDEDSKETVNAMINATDQVTDWMNRSPDDNEAIWDADGETLEWPEKEFNIFADGGLYSTKKDTDNMVWKTKSNPVSGKKMGLSRMSMYNYLSTSFTESSVIVYSNANSISEFTKNEHFNVNMIGTGLMKALFFLNFVACVGVLAIIGVSYSFNMAISGIRHGLKLLISIPSAMVGLVRGIAQVLSLVCVMIAEVMATIFMYTFVADLFVVFATLVENIAQNTQITDFGQTMIGGNLLSNIFAVHPTVLYNSFGSVAIMLVLETALVCFTGWVMMKYRRAFLYAHRTAWNKLYDAVLYEEVRNRADDRESVYPGFADSILVWLCPNQLEKEVYDGV